MTISQIRLFSIYLSKINPKDIGSRDVTFKLDEYARIMQFQRANTTRLKKTAKELLDLTVECWDETGKYRKDGCAGFAMIQLFKRFELYKNDDDGESYVSIKCHDDAVHLMFNLQKYFFKYRLWNALQLTSVNQQRLYELLKQYKHVGVREISVKDLREFLGMIPKEYARWDNFKTRVLDASQEALARYTDIKFTWEVVGRQRSKGGKITKLRFSIEKNNDYESRLTLDEFLAEQDPVLYEEEPQAFEIQADDKEFELPAYDEDDGDYFGSVVYPMISEACNNEFCREEMQVLYDIVIAGIPVVNKDETLQDVYDFLKRQYGELCLRAKINKIKNRFAYYKKIVKVEALNLKGDYGSY